MYECFNCKSNKVSWKQDFSTEDYGMEIDGVVSRFSCPDCGARIIYIIPFDKGDKDE